MDDKGETMESSAENEIMNTDVSIFEHIVSQTNSDDRRSLLLIQQALRKKGSYVYLEIGSHLGGTIQPHYADTKCKRIYSIDKRPLSQPDERGERYAYPENSTQTMRENLVRAFPAADEKKLVTFDMDASDVEPSRIEVAPDFCFIDGEHTDKALLTDFHFCQSVSKTDTLIATHDSGVVVNGLQTIKRQLDADHIHYESLKLAGSVYAIALGKRAGLWREHLADVVQDEDYFVRSSRFYLKRQKREAWLASWPLLLRGYRRFTSLKDGLCQWVCRSDRSC